jgi:hypothetical protein
MIKIAYLTEEQHSLIAGQMNTEYSTFGIMQDDQTSQYYVTEIDIINTNVIEFSWIKYLELVDLPEYEQYKFKPYAV